MGAGGNAMMEKVVRSINKGLFVLGIASVFGALAAGVLLIVTIGQAAIG